MTNKKVNNDREMAINGIQRSRNSAYCVVCGTNVRLVTPQETDEMYKANWAEMVKLTEKGVIHRIHNSMGVLQYCLNSLRLRGSRKRKIRSIILKPLESG